MGTGEQVETGSRVEIDASAEQATADASRAARRVWRVVGGTALVLLAGVLAVHVGGVELTYAKLHVFLLTPILLLAFTKPSPLAGAPTGLRRAALIIPPVLACVATAFSNYWDNFIASRGVWTFDQSKMVGVAGHIPLEEWFWFIDHTFLACFVAMAFWPFRTAREAPPARWGARVVGLLLCAGLCVWGLQLLEREQTLYLGIIMAFMAPVAGLQFVAGGHLLLQMRREWVLGILLVSVYLLGLDTWAITQDVWKIDPEGKYTTGLGIFHALLPGGIKLEQILIYSSTTLLVVQTQLICMRGFDALARSRQSDEEAGRARTPGQRYRELMGI